VGRAETETAVAAAAPAAWLALKRPWEPPLLHNSSEGSSHTSDSGLNNLAAYIVQHIASPIQAMLPNVCSCGTDLSSAPNTARTRRKWSCLW